MTPPQQLVPAREPAPLPERNPAAVRRELNEIEYFTWCFGQPYNIVATVQIDMPPAR